VFFIKCQDNQNKEDIIIIIFEIARLEKSITFLLIVPCKGGTV